MMTPNTFQFCVFYIFGQFLNDVTSGEESSPAALHPDFWHNLSQSRELWVVTADSG